METKEKIKLVRKDRVYLNNEADINVAIYSLDEFEKAKKEAELMTNRHGQKFNVKIVNEYVDNFGNGYQCKPSEIPWLIKKIEERYE